MMRYPVEIVQEEMVRRLMDMLIESMLTVDQTLGTAKPSIICEKIEELSCEGVLKPEDLRMLELTGNQIITGTHTYCPPRSNLW